MEADFADFYLKEMVQIDFQGFKYIINQKWTHFWAALYIAVIYDSAVLLKPGKDRSLVDIRRGLGSLTDQ